MSRSLLIAVVVTLAGAAFGQNLTQHQTSLFEALLDDYKQQITKAEASNAELQRQNKDLTDKTAALQKQLDDIKDAGRAVIAYNDTLTGEYRKLLSSYNNLAAQSDASTRRATILQNNLMQEEAQTLRTQRALAIFNAIPKPNAPYVVPSPVLAPNRLQTNCTTRQIGTSTYTNCN